MLSSSLSRDPFDYPGQRLLDFEHVGKLTAEFFPTFSSDRKRRTITSTLPLCGHGGLIKKTGILFWCVELLVLQVQEHGPSIFMASGEGFVASGII